MFILRRLSWGLRDAELAIMRPVVPAVAGALQAHPRHTALLSHALVCLGNMCGLTSNKVGRALAP